MTTHYIPPFTKQVGDRQLAVCGQPVTEREHATPPTCADCLAYLAQEPQTRAELEAQKDALFGAGAVALPMGRPRPVRARHDAIVDEYEANYQRRFGGGRRSRR